MNFQPNLLFKLLNNQKSWKIDYIFPTINLTSDGKLTKISLDELLNFKIQKGKIWSSISLGLYNQVFVLEGILNSKAQELKIKIIEDKEVIKNKKDAEQIKETLTQTLLDFNEFISQNRYLDNTILSYAKESFTQNSKKNIEILTNLFEMDPSLKFLKPLDDYFSELKNFLSLPLKSNPYIEIRKTKYINSESIKYKDFFDKVENTPLTEEQRISSIIFEDRNLLVAAAGSGKTSTIVGKVGYALASKLYKPEEILVLAFNRNAAEELKNRLDERLIDILKLYDQKIEVVNFHQLGVKVIGHGTGKSPSVSNYADNPTKIINEVIDELISNDFSFREKYIFYKSVYTNCPISPFDYESKADWENKCKQSFDRFKDGFETYQGEIVKSHGEKAIANWLFCQGIPYQYEASYEFETATENYRQYKPDFYLTDIKVYLEHFALDKDGLPPKHFGDKYLEEMKWKIETHKKHKTKLISTSFHEFITGRVFSKLEHELKSLGQVFKPLRIDEINSKSKQMYEYDSFNLFQTFLSHFKSNQSDISNLLSNSALTHRERLFLQLFDSIYIKYENLLRSKNENDFDDLINKSTILIEEKQYKSPFKLIVVDEFQDISQSRARLLISLLQQVPNSKLFCVGDDWQSIYRFAGSDISIFNQFEKIFGFTNITYLTQTFRSNQGITNVASKFIQKNPKQIKKDVDALVKNDHKAIEVCYASNNDDIKNHVIQILIDIDASIISKEKKTVFILGRYKNQNTAVLPTLNNCNVVFKTIHSSKGLQADFVILVGLNKGYQSFPSEREDDPILNLVLPKPENFPYSEERRLFYVALTRAKQKVFLIGDYNSVFLSELRKDSSFESYIQDNSKSSFKTKNIPSEWLCPQCNQGRLWKRNGPYGDFLACNRYPECNYTKNIKQKSFKNNLHN